jgi:molybdate transport system substrate-binding protein
VEALTRTLLAATSIAYSSSVSGRYLTTELFQRLGIADRVLPKSRRIEGERVGAVVARGDAELGFQQTSDCCPCRASTTSGRCRRRAAGQCVFGRRHGALRQRAAAESLIRFLASAEAAAAVARTGLEPVAQVSTIVGYVVVPRSCFGLAYFPIVTFLARGLASAYGKANLRRRFLARASTHLW